MNINRYKPFERKKEEPRNEKVPEFKEKVGRLARQISTCSRKMTVGDYQSLLDTEKTAGREGTLSMLIHKALREPWGIAHEGLVERPDHIKPYLDSFQDHVDTYVDRVSKYAPQIGEPELIKRLEDLAKELDSWTNDE